MITGFNTDVEHDGTVYHVQTEDKGEKSPLILSLVYVGGTILASKRTPYDDLIASGLDESVLSERLQRQHRLICAAIHTGRIEDLKRQTERDSAARTQTRDTLVKDEPAELEPEVAATDVALPHLDTHEEPPREVREWAPFEPAPLESVTNEVALPEVALPEVALPEVALPEVAPLEDLDIFELGSIADNMPPSAFHPPPVPVDAPEQPREPPFPDSVPPSVAEEPVVPLVDRGASEEWAHVDYSRVVDYSSDAERNIRELHISILDEKTKYVAGEFVKIQLHVGRGWDGHKSVVGAAVTLKVLGSSFRPMIFSGKTLADGTAIFYAMLPYFTSGRAAILISASDQDEKAELRRVIHQT